MPEAGYSRIDAILGSPIAVKAHSSLVVGPPEARGIARFIARFGPCSKVAALSKISCTVAPVPGLASIQCAQFARRNGCDLGRTICLLGFGLTRCKDKRRENNSAKHS